VPLFEIREVRRGAAHRGFQASSQTPPSPPHSPLNRQGLHIARQLNSPLCWSCEKAACLLYCANITQAEGDAKEKDARMFTVLYGNGV
jgi:hypothetical protein